MTTESVLRPWTMNDLDNLVKYGDNPRIAKFMSDGFPSPYTHERAALFIRNAMKDMPTKIFAISVEGEAVGGIGIHPQSDIHRRNAELGYWLAEPFWGKALSPGQLLKLWNIHSNLLISTGFLPVRSAAIMPPRERLKKPVSPWKPGSVEP